MLPPIINFVKKYINLINNEKFTFSTSSKEVIKSSNSSFVISMITVFDCPPSFWEPIFKDKSKKGCL